MQNSLLGRLVDALDCLTNGFVGIVGSSVDRCEGGPGACLDLRAHLAVGEVAFYVLAVALDLRLDVCHDDPYRSSAEPAAWGRHGNTIAAAIGSAPVG